MGLRQHPAFQPRNAPAYQRHAQRRAVRESDAVPGESAAGRFIYAADRLRPSRCGVRRGRWRPSSPGGAHCRPGQGGPGDHGVGWTCGGPAGGCVAAGGHRTHLRRDRGRTRSLVGAGELCPRLQRGPGRESGFRHRDPQGRRQRHRRHVLLPGSHATHVLAPRRRQRCHRQCLVDGGHDRRPTWCSIRRASSGSRTPFRWAASGNPRGRRNSSCGCCPTKASLVTGAHVHVGGGGFFVAGLS